MPIKVDIIWAGISREQFESIVKALDYENSPLDGHIMNISGHRDTTIRTTDTWVSQAAFDAFFNNRLLPIVKSLKIETLPEIFVTDLILYTTLEFALNE
jgi:hypothetical protein